MILPRFPLMVLRMKFKFFPRVLDSLPQLGPCLLPDSSCTLLFAGPYSSQANLSVPPVHPMLPSLRALASAILSASDALLLSEVSAHMSSPRLMFP